MATALEESRRCIESAGADPAGDRWTIVVWNATASLLLCGYFYEEEGAYDALGRWYRRRVRHQVVGMPINRARVKAMSHHFCALIRHFASAYCKERGACAHRRRSFEGACADRLVLRLHKAAAKLEAQSDGAEATANEALLARRGIKPEARVGLYDRTGWNRTAAKYGRDAGDNISIVLRTGLDGCTPRASPHSKAQLGFKF
jgi:hypothetical protein